MVADRHKKTMGDNMRILLFRSVRELLTNVVKHARAKKVRVLLTSDGDCVRIEIEDDGVGFDPQETDQKTRRSSGFSLFSIRERMADMGGAFDIWSEPGNGCTAVLTVPVEMAKD
jgi:signal transduction histidine kinase